MTALVKPEAWRQSRIASFDACPLSLKFSMEVDLRQSPGKMGHLGARGVLAHRCFAAAVNLMRTHREREIGVDQMMELLTRVVAQREWPTSGGGWEPCPDDEVVSLPIEELRWLRVACVRWAYQQTFTIERVVAVERRLYGTIDVVGPDGDIYQREITGMPDVLLSGPGRDEATLIDWKTGWAPPARKKERTPENPDVEDKLSDMGYVQQVVYGWLVLMNFPSIQKVTEREYYVFADEDPVREASVERWEMERIQDILAAKVSQMDAAIEADPALRVRQAAARKAKKPVPQGRWFPVPGTHCGFCVGRRLCPVRKHFGIPTTEREAQKLAREWHVGGEIRKERIPYVKGWVNEHGPIPIAHAKGRRVVGFKGDSTSLSMFEPEDAPASPFDEELIAAAQDSGVLVE